MPYRDLGRSLGTLDTLIEMLKVQVLPSFRSFGCGLGCADLSDLLIGQQLQDSVASNMLGAFGICHDYLRSALARELAAPAGKRFNPTQPDFRGLIPNWRKS